MPSPLDASMYAMTARPIDPIIASENCTMSVYTTPYKPDIAEYNKPTKPSTSKTIHVCDGSIPRRTVVILTMASVTAAMTTQFTKMP